MPSSYHIALSGAGGTGKGTLLKGICAKYNDIKPVTSVSTKIGAIFGIKNYKDMDLHTAYKYQWKLLDAHIAQDEYAINSYKYTIHERCAWDCIPYYISKGLRKEDTGKLYENAAMNHSMTKYDLIIFLPVEFENTAEEKKANPFKERDYNDRIATEKLLYKYCISNQYSSANCVERHIYDDNKKLRASVITSKHAPALAMLFGTSEERLDIFENVLEVAIKKIVDLTLESGIIE